MAGRVEAVGRNVTQFQPGDEVFGWCDGAFAEYVAVSEGALALKPANLTLEQAAVVPISPSPPSRRFATKDRFSRGRGS